LPEIAAVLGEDTQPSGGKKTGTRTTRRILFFSPPLDEENSHSQPSQKTFTFLVNQLGAPRVERAALLAFQADHVESPGSIMVAILAVVLRRDVGPSRHGRRLPLLTKKLEIGLHIHNAA
jgi:hypothetical protein